MSEKEEIKKMGGRAQNNSGRGKYQKADAKLAPFVVDIKEYKNSFSISRDVWAKICQDATTSGGEPALMLALGEGRKTVRVWVIADDMFSEMRQAYVEKYNAIR